MGYRNLLEIQSEMIAAMPVAYRCLELEHARENGLEYIDLDMRLFELWFRAWNKPLVPSGTMSCLIRLA